MKKIWLINQYAKPPELENLLRTVKFAQYLGQKDYDVTIFASSFVHNTNINLINDRTPFIKKTYGDISFVHIKGVGYKSNGLRRIYSLIEFPIKFLRHYRKFGKPDIIIQSATVPFGNIISWAAKKLNAQYIVEVVDLWPQTFVDLKIISKKNPFIYMAYKAEKKLYTKADAVVFSMEGGKDYIKEKKWDMESGGTIDLKKVFYINNGVDLNDFNHYVKTYKLEDPDLEDKSIKRIIYLGSMRLANNLMTLIQAAEHCKEYNDIKFLLYGDGNDRNMLEQYCKKQHLNNVVFKQKWIDPQYVPYVLTCSTVNILNYMPGGFGNYGGSQSKLFQYLASGNPICSNLNTPYNLININNVGISKEFDTPKEYADAILALANLDETEAKSLSNRAKKVAEKYDYESLTKSLINIFRI